MQIQPFFKYCPWCGSEQLSFKQEKEYLCHSCGQVYFHNVATAAGVLLRYRDQLVFIIRNQEPSRGKLHVPGGFVDPRETAEAAVRREVREELGLDLDAATYFQTFTNIYEYRGVPYFTCDLIFLARVETLPRDYCRQEIAGLRVLHPEAVEQSELAFPSTVTMVQAYRSHPELWNT